MVKFDILFQKYATTAIFENGDFLVICLIKAQAELWLSLPFFQLDASHKRVHSSRIKEVVFAAKIRSTRKSESLTTYIASLKYFTNTLIDI